MAIPTIYSRPMIDYPPPLYEDGDGSIPDTRRYLFPPRGVDSFSSPQNLPAEFSPSIVNLIPYGDSYKVRHGTDSVGGSTTSELLYSVVFQTATGEIFLLRWTLTGVEWLDGTTWRAMTGPTLSAGRYDRIALTRWGDIPVFSNGIEGMHSINLTTKTYAVISGAPSAVHLATFNRRVIASVPNTGRVQWCVAGDYTNWTSTTLGAGYEDLLAGPGGSSDAQSAVIPISDETAHVIRSGTLYQMDVTRNVNAPFAFSLLRNQVGSRWSATCVAVPGGSAWMADDGVWLAAGGAIQRISDRIKDRFDAMDQSVLRAGSMTYDQDDQSLRLAIPVTGSIDGLSVYGNVFRYRFDNQSWTKDKYLFYIKALSSVSYRKTLTIGELTGTVGGLVGPVGDLGVSKYRSNVLFTTGYDPTYPTTFAVVREAPERDRLGETSDWFPYSGGSYVNRLPQIYTGRISAKDPSRAVFVHDMQIVFAAPVTDSAVLQINVQYSTDDWSTRTNLFASPITFATAPSSARGLIIPIQIERPYVALTFDFISVGELRIDDIRLRVADGARLGALG